MLIHPQTAQSNHLGNAENSLVTSQQVIPENNLSDVNTPAPELIRHPDRVISQYPPYLYENPLKPAPQCYYHCASSKSEKSFFNPLPMLTILNLCELIRGIPSLYRTGHEVQPKENFMKTAIYILVLQMCLMLDFSISVGANKLSFYDLNDVNNPFIGLINMDITEFNKILNDDPRLSEEKRKEIINIRERILDGETDIGKELKGQSSWIVDKLKELSFTNSPIVAGMLGEVMIFPQFGVQNHLLALHFLNISYEGGIYISGIIFANLMLDGGLEKILESEGRVDSQKAVKMLEKIINNTNSPIAKYYLGKALLHGKKISANPVKAEKLLREAAESGYKTAKVYIHTLELNGIISKNSTDAELLGNLTAPADQGYMDASFLVAKTYEKGWFGMDKDQDKAIKYYQTCAGEYNLDAIRALSNIYEQRENYDEAYYWSYIEMVLISQFGNQKMLTYGIPEHMRLFGKVDKGIAKILHDKATLFIGSNLY